MGQRTHQHRPLARGKRRRGFRAGNSIIEMAIAFNVLLWLSMGMVEFGEFFYIRHAFEAAARDGARNGAMAGAVENGTVGSVEATMMNDLRQAIPSISTTQYTVPSWITYTITDTNPTTGATSNPTSVTSIPYGDLVTISLSTTVSQLPEGASIRPLHAITGKGISDTKVIGGEATFVKD